MNKTIVSGRDFIVFGLQPWDFEMGSNCKNIAIELAKNNRVLYVNRPIERSSLYKFKNDHKIRTRLKSLKSGAGVLEHVQFNIWTFNPRTILESINWLPPGKLYKVVSNINARRLAQQIRWALEKLNFNKPILFNDNDFLKGFYLNDHLKAELSVYYIRDYLLSQPYFTKHGVTMEPEFMTKSDLVVANSSYLTNYANRYNPCNFNIGQGCDIEDFLKDDYPIPSDMVNIASPIIGYCGALLVSRLDLDLLWSIAKQRPQWNLVLVGPEDEAFRQSSLHQLDNVYFLGSKPIDQLPAYINHFDICINPQRLNQMTIGNYPRKIDEYLAAGKQVVATETEAMSLFKEVCYLAKDAEDYIYGIEKMLALNENESEVKKRKSFAQMHTWEASVNTLYCAIAHVNAASHAEQER